MEFLSTLEPVFKPRSIAVIGASTAPGKLGHDILANLKNGGFAGPLYPINPKAEEILGLKVFKTVADLPEAPELAVVVIPAEEYERLSGRKARRGDLVTFLAESPLAKYEVDLVRERDFGRPVDL